MQHDSNRRPVRGIVDRIDEIAGRDHVRLRDVVEAFGAASFVPLMMVPALLVVSPLSGIPLFSTACGLTIAFVAAQMLARRRHVWLPDILMRQQIDGHRAREIMARLRRVADWLDGHSRRRLRVLTRYPVRRTVQILCLLCGLAMPLLEIVPFSSSILGAAVLLLATALLVGDGLFALFGLAVMALAVLAPLAAVSSF